MWLWLRIGPCKKWHWLNIFGGFPGGSAGKESSWNAEDLDSIPGLGRSPGEGNGYPPQYFGLENSMDCIVHGVAKSWTWLSNFHSVNIFFTSCTWFLAITVIDINKFLPFSIGLAVYSPLNNWWCPSHATPAKFWLCSLPSRREVSEEGRKRKLQSLDCN